MQTGKPFDIHLGRKRSWHFQTYSDGTKRWRQVLPQLAERPAEQEISRKRNQRPAERLAGQGTNKKTRAIRQEPSGAGIVLPQAAILLGSSSTGKTIKV